MLGEIANLPVARTAQALRAQVRSWRMEGLRVALTPTMGALHDGHLTLLDVARGPGRADKVAASIFVNPTQFAAGEDFDTYPRDEARDAAMLAASGCDLLYAPSPDQMYPDGFATEVRVTGLTDLLCGAARPGHFDGVALVVSKLLIQAEADVAVFGEKDWQQLAVIRRLAWDLDIPTDILGAPVLREADGLAMSSRNRYLSQPQRAVAPVLHRRLRLAASEIIGGADPTAACAAAASGLLADGFESVDYLEARTADSLALIETAPPPTQSRLFAAARLGRARLIDNVPIEAEAASKAL
ncbi:MAG: pantoate--beta-alanine ligase [Rhodobacteraceae bacterium]|nr:pantoate--beta-alanine ligase [Paracoccaceae bacterium]